ncbi:DUF6471 domain-containing protein [Rhodopseudomonas sp. BAL398]|nr:MULTISPECIES: DUF6471 domain-containing protein [Rhodopseudomonas]MDF3813983.1 DUF6471 domain-containing protein [Rhodopseudomonas sp. BAL398]
MIKSSDTRYSVPDTTDWAKRAKGVLKAELKRRNVGYRELAEKLTAMGTPETERNIANKISRGGFTAAFLLQCLEAVGCRSLTLPSE